MPYPNSFLGFIDAIEPSRLSGQYAEKFYGLLYGFSGDIFAELLRFTVHAPWLRDPLSPDDVLPYIAAERSLPKYSRETEAEWRARLADAWNIYETAGSAASVAAQLTAAKFPGGHVFIDPTRPGPNGEAAPHWSQFWIRLPVGSHYTLHGEPMSEEDFADIKFIAEHFSDVRYCPRGIILEYTEEFAGAWAGDAFAGDAFAGDGSNNSVTVGF